MKGVNVHPRADLLQVKIIRKEKAQPRVQFCTAIVFKGKGTYTLIILMLHPVHDHMYPIGGQVPFCLHAGITNCSTDATSRFVSPYTCKVWLKQHWVLKTKGYLVLKKTSVFRGWTIFCYCCNLNHRMREGCLAAEKLSSAHSLLQEGASSSTKKLSTKTPFLVLRTRHRAGCEEECRGVCSEENDCIQAVSTKMQLTGAHICKEALSCWNPRKAGDYYVRAESCTYMH